MPLAFAGEWIADGLPPEQRGNYGMDASANAPPGDAFNGPGGNTGAAYWYSGTCGYPLIINPNPYLALTSTDRTADTAAVYCGYSHNHQLSAMWGVLLQRLGTGQYNHCQNNYFSSTDTSLPDLNPGCTPAFKNAPLGEWVQLMLPAPVTLLTYFMQSLREPSPNLAITTPVAWTILAGNDAGSLAVLHSESTPLWLPNQTRYFAAPLSAPASVFRFVFTATGAAPTGSPYPFTGTLYPFVTLGNLQLYAQ